ncbi:MAG: threonylcarbamoyl-AMP synthase [Micavibrio sp.]|nr:threonylcarbamoyl-AMP synthase [Micavibrio sp.]
MIKAVSPKTISEAAQILRDGGLVGMPTETVYGLAANALDDQAVAKIFEAKGRPSFNPLIIHVENLDMAARYVEVNEWAKALAHSFWPGPLTLILPRREGCGISDLVSAGLETLAVRVPSHPAALSLIRESGLPLAAPSANKSGTLSPTTPAHVAVSLGDKVDFILAGGACSVGLESTVVDLSGLAPLILRPGAICAQELGKALGADVAYDAGDKERPKSPGILLKHYAPNTPLRLNAVDVEEGEALLAFGSIKFMGIKSGGHAKDMPDGYLLNLSENGDLYDAASNLFSMLKSLDEAGAERIAIMSVPSEGIGRAINDRLSRAAEK